MKATENPQTEFHLPDESRHYILTMEHLQCLCGCAPWLMRRKIGHNRWQFRVKCGNQWDELAKGQHQSIIVVNYCTAIEPTPWLNSSADAIQHWLLAKTLSAL